MVIMEVEDAFIITSVKNIFIYGNFSGESPIRIGDILYDDMNKMNIFEVYGFPSIRRSCGYRENYIDISIRPVSDVLDKEVLRTIAENLKGKRLVKI